MAPRYHPQYSCYLLQHSSPSRSACRCGSSPPFSDSDSLVYLWTGAKPRARNTSSTPRTSTSSVRRPPWGLTSLTLLDFRPTAVRQLAEVDSALAAITVTSMPRKKRWMRRAGASRVARWALLVRSKVVGEMIGLAIAIRAPCTGAAFVLFSHLCFWHFGAASLRVDAAAEPAPVPPQLAKMISSADAIVMAFAFVGACGPTSALRSLGAGLFAAAAAFVSAEAVPKRLAAFRNMVQETRPEDGRPRMDDLPVIAVK